MSCFFLVLLLVEKEYLGLLGTKAFMITYVLIFLAVVLLFRFTILRLSRVDIGLEGIDISNYFTTRRIGWTSVQNVSEKRLFFVTIARMHFTDLSGRQDTIYFLPHYLIIRDVEELSKDPAIRTLFPIL